MSDLKSKLPDLKELSSMTSKLFKGLKDSVNEIIQDYKDKRAEDVSPEAPVKPSAKKEESNKDTDDKSA
ncbi:MAG: hypothetical protein M1486_06405 [Gammaproteobacteria bacterium]|nr:hypothetical protein [Gammaproteobacteria bacterium]